MLSVLLALPLQAQVHIDSVEVAHILYGVPPQTSTNYTEEPNDSDEEGEDAILPFQTNNSLSWQEKYNNPIKLYIAYRYSIYYADRFNGMGLDRR